MRIATKFKPTRLRATLAVLLTAGLLLSGCADGLIGQEEVVPAEQQREGKLRHAHLLQRGDGEGANKVLERYGSLVTATEFVVKMTASSALSASKVLERYSNEPGVTVKRSFRRAYRGFAIHVDPLNVPGLLNKIEADPDIEWIEPDIRTHRPSPQASDLKGGNKQYLPWGVDRIDGDRSSTISGNGRGSVSGVELYILDSGIKAHDINVVEEMNFLTGESGENAASDALGHGTHVAGTAAAQDNSIAVAGVAPGARVHNFKVLDNAGNGDLSTAIAAVDLITERKVADPATPIVVNLSFGGDIGTTAYNALDEAIQTSIAAGVVYVIAAGNAGIDVATVTPAHVTEALTVGAYDKNDRFASFSNYGSLIDLLAPGVDIESCSNATGAKQPPVLMSGTSMASPHVAGAAALYLSRHPNATPQQVHDALVGAGQPWISGMPSGTTSRSVYVGNF